MSTDAQKRREKRKQKERERQKRRRAKAVSVSLEPGTGKPYEASAYTEPVAEAETPTLEVEAADGSARIRLYGAIGGWRGVGADEIAEAIDGLPEATTEINLHINSGGGSVFDAVAIYNLLASSGKRVNVHVEGVAASAATLVAMAGDSIDMAENAFWMVHKARGGVYGTAAELTNYIELLNKANDSLLLTYAARTGLSLAELDEMTSKDTWMSASEAKDKGFIDAVIEAKKVKPHVAPKSEAIDATKYDAERWADYVDDVNQIAASVATVESTIVEPSTETDKPLNEEADMPETTTPEAAATVDAVQPQHDPIAERKAMYERMAAVDAVLGKFPSLAAKALDEGWDKGRMEAEAKLETLRSERPQGPAIHGGDGGELTPAVAECALLQAIGSKAAADYKPEIQDKAHARYRGRVGIQQLLLEQAHANGYDRNVHKIDDTNIRTILQHCSTPVAAGGFTTLGTTGILGNTAKKALKAMFESMDQTWQQIASTDSTNDFKLVTRYRLLGHMEYEEVGKDGELKHSTFTEESHTEKLKTYGRMFAMTREDIINDDLGAFNTITRAMARGAALALNTVFWTEFLDDASFFSSGNSNLTTGASSALSSTSLSTLVQAFRETTLSGHGADSGTHFLALMPRILLVPPALESTADELFVARNVYAESSGAGTDDKVPNVNIHAGKYRPVVTPYIGGSGLSGGSDTAWYLLADPNELETIKVIWLNGQSSPTVESAEADFNVLGIQFRGYFDFDCKKTEYRAGQKSDGA